MTAVSSRLPPPTLPQVASAATTILAPASRGACPRTSATVTSTPARRSARSSSTAPSQCTSGLRRAGGRLLGPRVQGRRGRVRAVGHDARESLDHVVGVRDPRAARPPRRPPRAWPARRGRRWCPAARTPPPPGAAPRGREAPASAAARRPPSSRRPRRPRGRARAGRR